MRGEPSAGQTLSAARPAGKQHGSGEEAAPHYSLFSLRSHCACALSVARLAGKGQIFRKLQSPTTRGELQFGECEEAADGSSSSQHGCSSLQPIAESFHLPGALFFIKPLCKMPSCIVRGCTYSWYKKDPTITLHSFPRDLHTIKTWLLQTKQDFGNIDEFSQRVLEGTKTGVYRICSQHFTADSYEQCGLITYVKKGAVPTIFPQNKPPKKRKAVTVSLPGATKADLGILQPTFGNYTGAIPLTPGIHWSAMAVSSPKKKAYSLVKKSVGTCTEYFPGQVHKKTNTDPFWGTKNKEIQCCKRKPHRSIGLQCNLANLPPLEEWRTNRGGIT
ncbi:uncharacterized protein [Dendropsophus ebraccatus]|uniref:uncharacterized protein n=1 Tax=Dendropsophus ebraccatus TaxID=150705 RepID=UPI0038316A26